MFPLTIKLTSIILVSDILKGLFHVIVLLFLRGLLTADAGTAQVKNELKNYTTTNKGRWFLLFRTRMASVLFEKVCKKVV